MSPVKFPEKIARVILARLLAAHFTRRRGFPLKQRDFAVLLTTKNGRLFEASIMAHGSTVILPLLCLPSRGQRSRLRSRVMLGSIS